MGLFTRNRGAEAAEPRVLSDAERDQRIKEAMQNALFVETDGVWPYAKRYSLLDSVGHTNKAPGVGSPTIVWHMGIWPSRGFGEPERQRAEDAEAAKLAQSRRAEDDVVIEPATLESRQDYRDSYIRYEAGRTLFFEELNRMLLRLQERGRVADIDPLETFKPNVFHDQSDRREDVDTFMSVHPSSIGFTLWWSDDSSADQPNTRPHRPAEGDLRVRVECQLHRDHATLSFYIDAFKQYDKNQLDDSHDHNLIPGARRRKIIEMIDCVRRVSHRQITKGIVDDARIPEQDVPGDLAEELRGAADYLYQRIWVEFMEAFELSFVLSEPNLTSGASAEDRARYAREFRARNERFVRWREDEQGYDAAKEREQIEGAGAAGWAINRFADFRGVVMSLRGVKTAADEKRIEDAKHLRELNGIADKRKPWVEEGDPTSFRPDPRNGTTGVGDLDEFDTSSNEGNAVLKSLWPFIRRISPWADYRSVVGCGIIGMRALYISTLGATGRFFENEEFAGRKAEAEGEFLPERERVWARDASYHEERDLDILFRREYSRPQRFLVVTKGEPHREQIGRFIERITAVGTMRLYALRNFDKVRNAGIWLELLGRELDGVLERWSRQRREIERAHRAKLKKHSLDPIEPAPKIGSFFTRLLVWPRWLRSENKRRRINDLRVHQLSAELSRTELELIELGGMLDQIGEGGSGRLLYVIDRAARLVEEFEKLFPTLEITDIKGWISYDQFVKRGLKPTFDQVRAAKDRLEALRERLETITSTIQTSALIIEAEATRQNTRTLRIISNYFAIAAVAVLPAAVLQTLDLVEINVPWTDVGAWLDAQWDALRATLGLLKES